MTDTNRGVGSAREFLSDWYWYPSAGGCPNESGWIDVSVGGERGAFRPDLDRELPHIKVACVLHALHDSGLVYVSNGSMGESLAAMVADECVREDRYDQPWIVSRLAHHLAGDGQHWRDRAREFLG